MRQSVHWLVTYTVLAAPIHASIIHLFARHMFGLLASLSTIDVLENCDGSYSMMLDVEAEDTTEALAAVCVARTAAWKNVGLCPPEITELEVNPIWPSAGEDAHRHDSSSQCSIHDSLA